MEAVEIRATVDRDGNLKPDRPIQLPPGQQVRAILLLDPTDPDDEPAALVLDSIKQAWEDVQHGKTLPLAELWADDDE